MLLQQTGKAKHTKKTEDQNGMYHITPLGIHILVFTNKMIIYEINCDTSTWQTKKKKKKKTHNWDHRDEKDKQHAMTKGRQRNS